MDIEDQVRAMLARQAEEAVVHRDIGERARAGADRHRRAARLAAVGSAAAVLAVVGLGYGLTRPGTEAGPGPADRESTPRVVDPGPHRVAAGWRTEVWHEAAVDVPQDWGYGAGIIDDSMGMMRCSDGHLDADGQPVDDLSGWVGRPVMLSDMCMGDPDYLLQDLVGTPFVMFDTGYEVGSQGVGDGFTVETFAVDDSTVSVGWSDRVLRDQIVASIRPNDTGCASRPVETTLVPVMVSPVEDAGDAVGGQWCHYSPDRNGSLRLTGGGPLEPEAALEFWDAGLAGPDSTADPDADEESSYLVVDLDQNDPSGGADVHQRAVLQFDTGVIDFGRGQRHQVTEAAIEPIWNGALRTTVWSLGVDGAWQYDYVIGMLG